MVRGLAKSKFDLISERLLMCVVQRIRDTKVSKLNDFCDLFLCSLMVKMFQVKVRHAAIIVLSQLYRLVNANDEFSESERASVFIVFASIMNFYSQPLLEDRSVFFLYYLYFDYLIFFLFFIFFFTFILCIVLFLVFKSIDCRMLIEKVFVLNLVPYKMEVTKRVRIMINIFRNLDLRGMR